MNDYSDSFAPEDIRDNGALCVLSYLSILLIIPIFIRRNSPYVKFHTNQGLVLFVCALLLNILQRVLKMVFGFLHFVMIPINFVFAILGILTLVLIVMGVMNVLAGRAKELPIIGKIRLMR